MRINEIEAGEKVSFRNDTTSSGYNVAPEIDEVKQILAVVAENCSESIDAMKQAKHYLYRGIQARGDVANSIAFHGRSRENRKPLSTRPGMDETLNKGLRNSGMTAIRSNSIFCTSYPSAASSYGQLYLIFPKDGFKFTWNTLYGDFYTEYIYEQLERYTPDRNMKYDKFNELADTPDFANEYGFKNTDFAQAVSSRHEIMIFGEYYALYAADFKQYVSLILN